jgi:transposase, IS30 family
VLYTMWCLSSRINCNSHRYNHRPMERAKNNKKKGSGRCPLTLRERACIELRYRDGNSLTDIAKELGRDKGTVSREIDGRPRKGIGKYNADVAHEKALARIKKRGNTSLLNRHVPLRTYVVSKLKLGWSPEQVSIRLPIDYPDDKSMRVSYEAIYQYVYAQVHRGGNGLVKKECEDLRPFLRRRHKRRAKKGFRKAMKAERHATLPSIENRPQIVEKRSRVGDWEDDTIVSRASLTRIKSINERKTGIFFFEKTRDGTAVSCDMAVRRRLDRVPALYRKTLTRDRGSENREHVSLSSDLNLDVFFAHAYCSYERGSNENGNGLFRWYFPKGTDFAKVPDEDISAVEYLINSRPRKRLGGLTPYEAFYQETAVALFP